MPNSLFELDTPVLPIVGSDAVFPVRRIFCVGRNYAAHAREMGADPQRTAPFFFMKPADSVVPGGARLPYPQDTADFHHEVELVVALGRGGEGLDPQAALALVYGYAVGVDLTKRDRQAEAKKAGEPWERSKAFERSAPVSALATAAAIGHPFDNHISLSVNGATRQDATTADMIWTVPEIIARLSRLWTLRPGDLIFTGTPEGVGPLAFGDVVEARIESVGGLRFAVGSG